MKILLRLFCLAIPAISALCAVHAAWAKPQYAMKEEKSCQYCHVNVAPGQPDEATGLRQLTTRNPRGIYYQAHNHTFEGYSERQVMGAAAPPVYHLVWKEDLPDAPRRIAVADVTGDGKPRLITLNEDPERRGFAILTVKKWDGKAFTTEFTGAVKALPDKLAVGKFAGKDKPAVIVTGDALWYWDGKTYARKPASRPLPLFGVARLLSGSECLVLGDLGADGKTPVFKAYRVDTSAAEWLTDRSEAPTAKQVSLYDMRADPEFFHAMGIVANGVIGLWDVRKFGTLFFYYVRGEPILETSGAPGDAKDPKQGKVTSRGIASHVAFRDPSKDQGEELWSTPKMEGMVMDVAQEDGKGSGKPGLLVLTSASDTSKTRMLTFFLLD
ncbi:MAG TPA: hypothetical protein VKU00_22530 [Chthonomonadaceae bacterium]|nr:hypothetical protein [Chthonomonadaceae bacterium]